MIETKQNEFTNSAAAPPDVATADGLLKTEPAVEAAPMPTITPEVARFYEGHRVAMLAWTKRTGNTNFPIVEEGGQLRWINRKERRKRQKSLRQQLRERKVNV